MYAQEDEPQTWEDLIRCIDRVRARKTPKGSTGPLTDGLQYGCGIARLGCYALPHVLPAKQHFLESRRADSNRFTAPATSVLLAIWVRPNGLLAELRPYPP